MLIHGNYMSQRDMDICLDFDVETLREHKGIAAIRELHAELVREYETDEPNAPA